MVLALPLHMLLLAAGHTGRLAVPHVARPLVAASRLASSRARGGAPSMADVADPNTPPVRKLLGDLTFMGPVRFIVQGQSAIMETVAEAESVAYKTLDDGTELATIKTDDAEFEAHLKLGALSAVKFETKEKGGRQLYFVRFVDANDAPALTCLLHAGADGEYDASAVKFWEGLKEHFGESVRL